MPLSLLPLLQTAVAPSAQASSYVCRDTSGVTPIDIDGTFYCIEEFSTAGSHTWTAPWTTPVRAFVVGAGGGGTTARAGSGGEAKTASSTANFAAGTQIEVLVGEGGDGRGGTANAAHRGGASQIQKDGAGSGTISSTTSFGGSGGSQGSNRVDLTWPKEGGGDALTTILRVGGSGSGDGGNSGPSLAGTTPASTCSQDTDVEATYTIGAPGSGASPTGFGSYDANEYSRGGWGAGWIESQTDSCTPRNGNGDYYIYFSVGSTALSTSLVDFTGSSGVISNGPTTYPDASTLRAGDGGHAGGNANSSAASGADGQDGLVLIRYEATVSTSPPTVTTNAASDVTTTSATLNATVNANGSDTTALSYKYSADRATVEQGGGDSPTSITPGSVTGSTDTALTAPLTGLTPGTTYYYRFAATNAGGTTNGSIVSFTTLSNGGGGGGGGGGGSAPAPAATATPTPTQEESAGSTGSSAPPAAPTSPLIPTGDPSAPPVLEPITWPGTPSGDPSFSPGDAGCLCAGSPTPVDVDDSNGDVAVSANGTTTTLQPKTSAGSPTGTQGSSGPAVIQPGGTTAVSGSGYQPGSLVTVFAQPGRVKLGTLTVGPDGTVTGSVYIPTTLPQSGVTLQIDGVPFGGGPSSGPISVGVGVETGTPAPGSSGGAGSAGKGAAGTPTAPVGKPGGGLTTVKPGNGKVVPASGGPKPEVSAEGVKASLPNGGNLEATLSGPTGITGGSSGGGGKGPQLEPGGFVEVKGDGLEPGTSANVWFIPTGSKKPVFGGTVQVGANGEVKGWASIPPGLPEGGATMQIDVTTQGKPGKGATVSVGVTVGGPPPVVEGKPAKPITPDPAPWPGAGPNGPSVPTGTTEAVCSGCSANPPVTTSPEGSPEFKSFEIGGITVGLGSTGTGGANNPQSESTPLSVTPGGFVTVRGSGFRPGTPVSVFANPGKVLLGTITAGPDGSVSGSVPVPATVPANATIQLDGVTSEGAEQSVATGSITTEPVPATGPLSGLGQGPAAQPTAPLPGRNGTLPKERPGQSSMIPAVPAVAPPTVNNGTITTGLPTGGSVSVTPVNDDGTPSGGSTAAAVRPTAGGLVGVKGSGFAPGTTVQVWFLPGPIFAGSVSVGSDGTVEGWAQVPPGTEPGNYTMQLSGTGTTPSGTKAPVGWSQGVTVAAGKGGGSNGSSANTDPKSEPVLPPAAQPLGQPGGGLPQQEPGSASGAIGPVVSGGVNGGAADGATFNGGGTNSTPVTTSTETSEDGTSVTVTATTGGGASGGPSRPEVVTVNVSGGTPNGRTQPVAGGGVVNAPQGGFINTSSGGLAPGTPVNVFLLPSLTPVGSGTVGPRGIVTLSAPVPTSTPVGGNTLQITGVTPSGRPIAVNLGVNIEAGTPGSSPVSATSPLAATPKIAMLPNGRPVSVGQGDQAVLFNGTPTPYTISSRSQSTTVGTSVSSVVIKAPRNVKGAVILTPGTEVAIEGTGALPGSVVNVWSARGERLLGRLMVAADGSYTGWVRIPVTLPATVDTLQINTVLSDRTEQMVALGVNYERESGARSAQITRDRAVTYFGFNSAKLTKESKAALREFATLFPTNAFSVTTVAGALRASGADADDRRLATKRARNVKRFLESQGVQGIINVTTEKTKGATPLVRRVISVTGG